MGLGSASGTIETSSLMKDFLRQVGGAAVVDGGLATELERHGADLNDPLWSAKCLLTSPHLIRQVPPPFQSLSASVCLYLSICSGIWVRICTFM